MAVNRVVKKREFDVRSRRIARSNRKLGATAERGLEAVDDAAVHLADAAFAQVEPAAYGSVRLPTSRPITYGSVVDSAPVTVS